MQHLLSAIVFLRVFKKIKEEQGLQFNSSALIPLIVLKRNGSLSRLPIDRIEDYNQNFITQSRTVLRRNLRQLTQSGFVSVDGEKIKLYRLTIAGANLLDDVDAELRKHVRKIEKRMK